MCSGCMRISHTSCHTRTPSLLRWNVARGALLVAAGVDRTLLAATRVVSVSSLTAVAHACQTANATTDQCSRAVTDESYCSAERTAGCEPVWLALDQIAPG